MTISKLAPPPIEITHLNRVFGTHTILDDISFSIRVAESVALVGENGSGKTTLLRILATLLLPTQGEAWIGGHSVYGDPRLIREKIGWVPAQDGGFFPRLSGRDNLLCFGALRGAEKKQILELIEIFSSMGPFRAALKTPFYLCSSGMKQSLSFVRALLGDPLVLILDEPTRSLDHGSVVEFGKILKERFSTKTVFFSTHSLENAEILANRVVQLENGKLRTI